MWATARIAREIEMAEGRLAKDVQDLLLAEREQGRSPPPPPTLLGSSLSLFLSCVWTSVSADPALTRTTSCATIRADGCGQQGCRDVCRVLIVFLNVKGNVYELAMMSLSFATMADIRF